MRVTRSDMPSLMRSLPGKTLIVALFPRDNSAQDAPRLAAPPKAAHGMALDHIPNSIRNAHSRHRLALSMEHHDAPRLGPLLGVNEHQRAMLDCGGHATAHSAIAAAVGPLLNPIARH